MISRSGKGFVGLIAGAMLLMGCGATQLVSTPIENIDRMPLKVTELTEEEKKNWGHADLLTDTIPGIRVVVAGLDMDFKGNPFGPMPSLMATAEYVTKVHAICTRTGNLANYSFRKSSNNDLVLLGETEEYEPLSRAAFYKAMLREKISHMDVEAEEVVHAKKKANG